MKRIWRQWLISRWTDGAGDPARMQELLATDEAARKFHEAANRLALRLRQEAREERADAPPFLHARIMAHLGPAPAPLSRSWQPALAGALLLALLGGTYLLAPRGATPPGPGPHVAATATPAPLAAPPVGPREQVRWTRVGSLVDARFGSEVQGLSSDVTAAVKFIGSCLGTSAAPATPPRAGRSSSPA